MAQVNDDLLTQPQTVFQMWNFSGGFKLARFLTAKRPDVVLWAGAVIFVTDAASGSQFQASNGVTWKALG